MTKTINPAWRTTLEFLARMVSPEQAEEIVQEASRSYFEGRADASIGKDSADGSK